MAKCEHPNCNNEVTEYTKKGVLKRHCSTTCRLGHNSIKSRDKARQTCIDRFGVPCVFQSEDIKTQIKLTNITLYGVENVSQVEHVKEKKKLSYITNYGVEYITQSPVIKEKIKKTNLETMINDPNKLNLINMQRKDTCIRLYGVDNPMKSPLIHEKNKLSVASQHGTEYTFQSKEIKDTIKQTHLRNRGVENPMQSPEIREKSKRTCLRLHGVEYSFQSSEVKTKILNSNNDKYGVSYPIQSDIIQFKLKQTNLSRYGSTSFTNKHIPQEIQQLINDTIWLKEQNTTKTLEEIADELNINSLILSRRFKKFNIPVKHHAKSYFEKQVYEYVLSIYPNIIQNDRKQIKPYELDIYFPTLNLAIECNGRYFHQDEEREQNKINLCQERNIDLHFIWDDEWYTNIQYWKQYIQDIIYSKIN